MTIQMKKIETAYKLNQTCIQKPLTLFEDESGKSKLDIEKIEELQKPLTLLGDDSGFMSVLLVSFSALILTGVMGISLLSVGIKNITKGQTICIQTGLKGQKRLAGLLEKILRLNDTVRATDNSRKAIEAGILSAFSSGMIHLIPALQKKLTFVKQTQSILMSKQKLLLGQSEPTRIETFKRLKSRLQKLPSHRRFKVWEKYAYPKALALKREKIGDRAYIYKPKSDFSTHQKSQFLWEMNPFYPLSENLKRILPGKQIEPAVYSCSVSLEKRGRQWIGRLYH